MLQTNQEGLTFDLAGVPPSQAEIDAYIETLRPQSKAAKRKSGISLAVCLVSVFGFIFTYAFWVTNSPPFLGVPSFVGPALLSSAVISGISGHYFFTLFDRTHRVLEQKIDNSAVASLDLLEEFLEMVTTTGIRPVYINGVAAQERELTVSEVLDLKALISKEQLARKRVETQIAIQTALGVPTNKGGSPSDDTDTHTDALRV